MPRKTIFRSRVLAVWVIIGFFSLLLPIEALSNAQAKTGSITGYVYEGNLDTPVEKAVVKIRNVTSKKEFQSAPTNKTGNYQIKDIEEGRYTLGVTTKEGNFNFEFIVFIKANEEAKINVALKPGVASVLAKKENKAFFLTPLGLAVILGSAGSAAIVYGATQDKDHASAYKR
jgi:hypothetical protein